MYDLDKNVGTYEQVIDSFEVEVLIFEQDLGWDGDSFYALRDNGRYGFLVFGWGSCSGCDALEGSYGDVVALNELRDRLWNDVKWFDSVEELRDFIQNRDAELQWYGRDDTYKRFAARSGELTD